MSNRWATLQEFADWYKAEKFPIRPPFEDPIYVTDISYSLVLFREGQYQAELYLVRPNTGSPPHSHPRVENMIMVWGGDISFSHNGLYFDLSKQNSEPAEDGTSKLFGVTGPLLTDADNHALFAGDRGGAFLSLEKWPEDVKPNSVTINWDGEPVDESHKDIIQKLQTAHD